MAGNFVSSLWATTSTNGNRRVTNLTLTVPPATAGTSFTIQINPPSGVTLGTVTYPPGVTWNAANTTLTIGSTFSGSGMVVLPLTSGNVTNTSSFVIELSSGSAQTGGQTSVQVDANGWMNVTALASGVTMEGLYYLIQNLPSGGQVRLEEPVLLIPNVNSGQPDFSFTVGVSSHLSGGSLALSSSNTSAVSISGSTATAQSSLAGGNTATVTATYTVNGSPVATSSFTVQRLSSTTVTSGSSSTLNLTSQQRFTVKILGSNVYLRGIGVHYETTSPGTYNLMFYTNTSGLQFNSSSVSLTHPDGFTFSNPNPGFTEIITTNMSGTTAKTGFTLATNMGVLSDPTIINNPDT